MYSEYAGVVEGRCCDSSDGSDYVEHKDFESLPYHDFDVGFLLFGSSDWSLFDDFLTVH